MPTTMTVGLGAGAKMVLGQGSIASVAALIGGLGTRDALIVADDGAWRPHGARMRQVLSGRVPHDVFVSPPDGFRRELSSVAALVTWAADAPRRPAAVVAFGGGATQNVAGVFCALLAAQPRLVRVPTTLTAMVDAAPSMRQALDAGRRKNQVRLTYPPSAIVGDTSLLETAPAWTTADGFVEGVKAGMVAAPDRLPPILDELRRWALSRTCDYERVVEHAVAAKLGVLEHDREEVSEARCLRYGHEIADLVEECTPAVSHGEAVGIGMEVSAEVAHRLGAMDADAKQWHDDVMDALRPLARQRITVELVAEGVDAATEALLMVLLSAAGEPYAAGDGVLTPVPRPVVVDALRTVLGRRAEC